MLTMINYEGGHLGRNKGCGLAGEKLSKNYQIKFSFPKINLFDCDKALKQIEGLKGNIFLGGDHSITYALVKGFKRKFKKFGLVVFDAHPDCCKPFKTVTHEDWLRKLIEEKTIKKKDVLLVGIREIDKTEVDFLKGIKIVRCNEINNAKLMDFFEKYKYIYLSLDIDVVDPKDAPGTGCRVKNGIKGNTLLQVIKEIKKFKNIKRIDIVEFNPLLDKNKKTITLAKKILQELI